MILLLAAVGGSVDALILLGFGVLTAAQTGNTVLMAIAIAQGHLTAGLRSAISVVGYISGAAVGELVIVRRRDVDPWRSAIGGGMIAELLPLGGLLGYWHLAGPAPTEEVARLLIALAAIAMGIQSAVVLYLHYGPTTTYVTGMLTSLTTESVRLLRFGEIEQSTRSMLHDRSSISAWFSGGPWIHGVTWLAYFTGAMVSGMVYVRAGELALALPIAAIVAVIVESRHS